MIDWLTREDVAKAMRRQPRWVTEHLFSPRLLSFAKIGNEYYVVLSGFDAFLFRFKKK